MSITEKVEYYLTEDYRELEFDEELNESDSIKEWDGIDKKKNKIRIEQKASDAFQVSVTTKKGKSLIVTIKKTLQDAMDAIKKFTIGNIKWAKDKIKKKSGSGIKARKSGILVGRVGR